MDGESRWKIVLSDGRNNERTYYEWGKTFAEAYNAAISEWCKEFPHTTYFHVYNRKMEDYE